MTIQEELRTLADELDANPELAAKIWEGSHIDLYVFSNPGEFKADSKLLGGKRDKKLVDGYQKHSRQITDHTRIHVMSSDTCEKVPTGRTITERVAVKYEDKEVPEYEWKCE